MSKTAILIFALSRSPWIGGIYYRKNIIHMLLANENISVKHKIIVITNDRYKDVFRIFANSIEIISCSDETGIAEAAWQSVKCCICHKIKYVFPLRPFVFLKMFGITPVSWIADFQHCHYPEFFSKEELKKRNSNFRQMADAKTPLVLSSNDALSDFRKYYSESRENVFVVHFTSYIEDELQKLNLSKEREILTSFGLQEEKYAVICNQFWKHKNHGVVLEAIKILKRSEPEIELQFVFTGELSDRRNPQYIEELKLLLSDADIRNSVKVLGFVDRMSQLCIMKYSEFIIQPSLFEGWGTVVEDGKVLNKPMILSDIAVHEEQKNENCMLFHKEDPEDLAKAIRQTLAIERRQIPQSKDLTEQYSKVLEKIFISL